MSDRVVIDGDVSLTSTIDGEGGAYIRLEQNPVIEPLEVTENGMYEVPEGVEGFNPVIVNTEVDALRSEIDSAIEASGCNPLTEGINTLIIYANETTGKQDTTLSDSIETLVAGYGDYDIKTIIEKSGISGDIVYDGVANKGVSLSWTNITSVKYTNVVNIHNENRTFASCPKLKRVDFPKLTSLANSSNTFDSCHSLKCVCFPVLKTGASQMFAYCSNLLVGVFPKLQNTSNNMFMSCKKFETLDIGATGNSYDSKLGDRVFNDATLKRLILRPSDRRVILSSTAKIDIGAAMQLGGAGVDIYIPKSMYDCLGDGSNLDYLALKNWATVNDYGTITWKQIEGSQYEDTNWWQSLID